MQADITYKTKTAQAAKTMIEKINDTLSRESSSTVTAPLEWEQARQQVAIDNGFEDMNQAYDRVGLDKYDQLDEEAALLFMRSHTNHALSNFIENHATQIIPGK